MRRQRSSHLMVFLGVTLALLASCGHQEGNSHEHKGEAHKDHDHEHEEESSASFKPGKGLVLPDETQQNIGLEVAEVMERTLPNQIHLTVQVFGEKHHHKSDSEDHSGCDVQGSGFLSTNTAAAVRSGQPVQLLKDSDKPLSGVVLAVQKALALGESEILIGVSNATAMIKSGEFVPACISLPGRGSVLAIPESALLRTSEGTFVYVVNGEAYLRTAVKIGTQAAGWVEITDGLLAGDRIATKPVQALWLIELRATKGGGHSH